MKDLLLHMNRWANTLMVSATRYIVENASKLSLNVVNMLAFMELTI